MMDSIFTRAVLSICLGVIAIPVIFVIVAITYEMFEWIWTQ